MSISDPVDFMVDTESRRPRTHPDAATGNSATHPASTRRAFWDACSGLSVRAWSHAYPSFGRSNDSSGDQLMRLSGCADHGRMAVVRRAH
ncbi:MAG: hypothetical protein ACRD2W_08570 [Acidimicrobiales bacterium]